MAKRWSLKLVKCRLMRFEVCEKELERFSYFTCEGLKPLK